MALGIMSVWQQMVVARGQLMDGKRRRIEVANRRKSRRAGRPGQSSAVLHGGQRARLPWRQRRSKGGVHADARIVRLLFLCQDRLFMLMSGVGSSQRVLGERFAKSKVAAGNPSRGEGRVTVRWPSVVGDGWVKTGAR